MKNHTEETIKKIHLPSWEEIPNIDLYLDQVISFIDGYFSPILSVEGEGPILTKTMVNNYVKNKIIASPVKKKYDKNCVCALVAVCILKSVYNMHDISILIKFAFDMDDNERSYTRFCNAIESAITCTFEGKPCEPVYSDFEDPYLLQAVAQSIAGKLYSINRCKNLRAESAETEAVEDQLSI